MEISTLGGGEDEDGNEIEGDAGEPELARAIFERGYKDLRNKGEKEEVCECTDVNRSRLRSLACSSARGVEIVRATTWYRRGTSESTRDDADDPQEVAQGRGWKWHPGRVYVSKRNEGHSDG